MNYDHGENSTVRIGKSLVYIVPRSPCLAAIIGTRNRRNYLLLFITKMLIIIDEPAIRLGIRGISM